MTNGNGMSGAAMSEEITYTVQRTEMKDSGLHHAILNLAFPSAIMKKNGNTINWGSPGVKLVSEAFRTVVRFTGSTTYESGTASAAGKA